MPTINFEKLPRYIVNEISRGNRVIKRGQSGQQVKRVQEWLRYHECRTSIDGAFGPATADCVARFQEQSNLPDTGRVNEDTWQALISPLHAALKAPTKLNRPIESIIASIAQQHLAQHPIEIGGSNCGPWVRLYCGGNDGSAWAWCAGFVTLIMQQAHFYVGTKTPIEGSVSCDSLAAQAKEAGRFVKEREITRGRFDWDDFGGCSVFLRRRTSTDWTHAGFAFESKGRPKELTFKTIEGNTNDEGVREGFEACERTRSVVNSNYDFIRLGA